MHSWGSMGENAKATGFSLVFFVDFIQEGDIGTEVCNAGINLTGYHPPEHPGAFAPKCVPSPRTFAQQKMPGGGGL